MDRRFRLGAYVAVIAVLVASCGGSSPSTVSPSGVGSGVAPSAVPSASASSAASTSPAPSLAVGDPPTIRILGDQPVLRGRGGPAGFSFVLPGAAIEHDGVIHAWLVWFTELPDTQIVTHASSPDGRTWTIDPDPAYTDLGLGLFAPGPIPADARVEADGTWVLYGWGTPDASRRTFMSWRATAPGPDGPWTAQRILGPADAGNWDDNGVLMTSVVAAPNGLELYYEGTSRRATSTSRIGLARSDDGVAWTRVSPPGADAGGGPVFEPGRCAGLAIRSVTMPNVTLLPDGRRLMLTTGFQGSEAAVSAATSSDGIAWECAGSGPVLERTDVPGSAGLHTVELFERTSGPTLLIESLGDGSSDVWLAEVVMP